jgi:hypothetical protein
VIRLVTMRVTNTSRYDTDVLRRICTETIKRYPWQERVKTIAITFKVRNNGVRLSYRKRTATYKGSFTVSMPTNEGVQALRVATAVLYGCYLADGVRRAHIPSFLKTWDINSVADLMPVDFKSLILDADPAPEKAKPTQTQKEEGALKKLEALRERQSKWTSKLKRAETALKKLQRQISYYDRVLKDRTQEQVSRSATAKWNI